jgi:ankyrin repeat protein
MLTHRDPELPMIEFVTFLRHFSSHNFSINWQDEKGRTPLHNAVMRGDLTTVDMLINNSDSDDPIDLNILDKDQYSALGMSMREEKMRIAYKILDQKYHLLNLDIGGGSHSTLMHLAVAKLDVKAVVKLLLRNADVNSADLKTGDTPLHLLMNVFSKN